MSLITTILLAAVGFFLLVGVFYLLRALALKIRISDWNREGQLRILEEEMRNGEITAEECRRRKNDLEEL